jgi:N-acetylated-alpha-linked acidic dipeptidase
VKTLPAVREALEQRRWDEAEAQIRVVADVLERAAGVADSAAALVR